jgi:hypothetical protein
VSHHYSEKSQRAKDVFEKEIHGFAQWVAESGLGEREVESRLLRPLQLEWISHYGIQVGSSLYSDFLAAYRLARQSACARIEGDGDSFVFGNSRP